MELLFRKYFWAINLAFLLCAAYLAARTVNVFFSAALAPMPSLGALATAGSGGPQGPQKTALGAEALSKLTGIALPKPEPEVKEPTAPTPADVSKMTAVKTSLRVKLVGTVVSNVPEWSMASIMDVNANDTSVYMVGSKILNAEVLEIEWRRVLINNNGRKEYIDNEPGDGSVPVAATPTPPVTVANATPVPTATGSGVRATGDDTYEVPKAEIEKTLSNLNDVAMQARIVPAFKDGVATGFKLFSIRPDSIYTKIGIQNGDIVRRINGFEINSPEKALEIYSKLRESSRIEIEIDRNGSVQRKTYNVR